MRFKCEHCSAQYMIADEKVGSKGVRVRCKKCGEIITVKPLADEEDATTSVADSDSEAGRDETEVNQSPDESGEARDETTVDQPGGEEGFDLGDDEELGSAFDSLLGDENENGDGDVDEDGVDYDRQSTRVFNMQEMAKVQNEKDQAAQDRDQISDLYNSAQESERETTGQTSPGLDDRDKAEWYAAVDEQQVGPMNAAELEDRFRQGEFDADTLVWKSGFDDWLPVAEVDIFRHLTVSEPEPPVPDAEDKTIAWGREQESEDDLGIDEALGAPQRDSFEDEAADDLGHDEGEYGDDAGGLYDDEEASAAASAAAFAGADVDWKPSAIANLNSLAEEELASLAPPEETESESEFPFGDDEGSDGEEEGVESGEMEEGDSSIIGQIAAEEEAAARRAEEKKQVDEQRAEEVKKKQEEEDLAAQEAARREREEEQRDKAAPPPDQVMPRSGFPKWAIGLISGVVGVIVILLGFIAYKLATGTSETTTEHKTQPMTPPANTASVQPKAAATTTKPTSPTAVPATKEAPKPAEAASAAPPGETAKPKPEPKVASAEKAKAATPPPSKPAIARRDVKRQPKRTPAKRRKKKTVVTREKEKSPAPVVREPPPIAEPPPPPRPKPRRKKDKSGLLDFDDEAAFAEETGSKTAAVKPPPKPVKKELPPLTDADVMAVMRNHVPEFKACNRKQGTIDRSVRGKMVVSFTISPSGKVSSATTKTARFKSTFVSGCITKVIKQLRFPKFGGKPKRVPFPFTVK